MIGATRVMLYVRLTVADMLRQPTSFYRRIRAVVLPIAGILSLASCDRAPIAMPATQPSTAPAKTQAAAAPVAEPSIIVINQHRHEFPPAKMQLQTQEGRMVALVYSDDPRTAINDSFTGNSFYLQMPLEIADPAELNGAAWQFKAMESERQDSPYGIFLEGNRYTLQPMDVQAQFDKETPEGGATILWLSGTFRLYDAAAETSVGELVPVAAKLTPTLEQRRRAKSSDAR